MEHNRTPFAPEAATDEPASSFTPVPAAPRATPFANMAKVDEPDDPAFPEFETDAEDHAYWQGVTVGIRSMGAGPAETPPATDGSPAPFETRRQRRARHDGFTPPRRAVFLEGIAEGMTVARAAAAAGVSTTTVYNLRNRREGRAFDIACEAAIRRGRRVIADRQRDRAIEGQIVTRYDKDGNVVGTRHYHDNRLATAVLTRLDKKAETVREDERLIVAISEEFEELLDCIEEGGDAEAFIEARRPPPVEPARLGITQGAGAGDAAIAARWRPSHRYDDVDPDDIDISDLDPDEMQYWTEDEWDRAEASGLMKRLIDGPGDSGEGEAPAGPIPGDGR